ncbi:MAG: ATP-binding protein [Rhizobiaceae bacterium]
MKGYPQKWRPTLSMIVVSMLVFILCLPLGGIWLFRFYDNKLVQETESELIAQGAFVKAIFARELGKKGFDASNLRVEVAKQKDSQFNLILPQLDLSSAYVQQPRPEAVPVEIRPLPVFANSGQEIKTVIQEAQKTTLAGFRVLDPNGIVITGKEETGLSLAHIPEVKQALAGQYASAIRQRISDSQPPPIYSVSRGTGIRIFVAMPIAYDGKVAGVAYLSRTPSHFLRELYGQRWKLAAAISFLLAITLIIAFIFIRTIKGPIDALNARTERIAKGDRTALAPLERHGTREIASLSEGLLFMSEKLQDRSDYIKNFATHVSHELKSPLTSIKGAAELLADLDSGMTAQAEAKFLKNILSDTDRMTKLLDRLRDLAAAEGLAIEGECHLEEVLLQVQPLFPELIFQTETGADLAMPMPLESAVVVFSNMADNSLNHGANKLEINCRQMNTEIIVLLLDNGTGITEANREKVFDLFFTTRRESGGTGMGLGIVQSILQTHGGKLELLPSPTGALFEISLPKK